MHTLKERFDRLPPEVLSAGEISILPIRDDYDLWFATIECKLASGQEDYVNPAGFSIGRAYLNPQTNIPCIIRCGTTRIGYIVLREWSGSNATSWSYYLDRSCQGKGYGKAAARLAIQILKAAAPELPVKLSAEQDNTHAHRLYQSIGFLPSGETDGDDLVFIYE